MSKESVKEFGESLKKSGEDIKHELVRKGLNKDPILTEKVKKISEGLHDASEYIKKRIEK